MSGGNKRERASEPAGGTAPDEVATPEQMEVELDNAIAERLNIGGLITKMFIDSKTTLLIMLAALLFGLFALFVTPREENPQISVPAVNVIIPFPGASPQEVENLVAVPMERRIWNIKGIEHVYSISYPDFAVVTAQFLVGENQEDSVFKVYNQVYSNLDALPAGVQQPLIKPVDINDVPIVAITLFSATRQAFELRQAAEHLMNGLREVPGTSSSVIVGGDSRVITVELDPVKSAAYAIDPVLIAQALEGANLRLPADRLETGAQRILVRSGQFLRNAEDIGSVVLTTRTPQPGSGGPADLPARSGARSPTARRRHPTSAASASARRRTGLVLEGHGLRGAFQGATPELSGRSYNAVTIAIAKQKGDQRRADQRGGDQAHAAAGARSNCPRIPGWTVTRDDGEGANHAVNELVTHLSWAIVIVLGLLVVTLGWRDAAVVAFAIPLTLLVTLGVGLARRTDDQPHHAVRADPKPRPAGGRRDRRRGKHPPPSQDAAQGRIADPHLHPGGQRDQQPDDLRHADGDRLDGADGLCHRHDGAVHGADPVQRAGGDARQPARGVQGHAVPGPALAQGCSRTSPRPAGRSSRRKRSCTADRR